MRIGFDVDGVLADFIPAYQRLCVEVGGRDLFYPDDIVNPPCWNWPEYRGYTRGEVSKVWDIIKASESFWADLGDVRQNTTTMREVLEDLERRHDIYYITSRVGLRCKAQTEGWLEDRCGANNPTVLISPHKGQCADALNLDAYIDDNLDNANSVANAVFGRCQTFLLDRNYNQGPTKGDIVRVGSVGQMLDYLILEL